MKASLVKAVVALVVVSGFAVPARADDSPGAVVVDSVVDGGTHSWTTPVVVRPGATLTIKNATVNLDWLNACTPRGSGEYCQPNIMVDRGTLRVIDSTINSTTWDVGDLLSGYSIDGWAATYDFENSIFQHYKGIGNQFASASRSTVRANTFRWATTAFAITRGAEADVIGNVFEDALYGLVTRDTSIVIRDNHFNHVQRISGTGDPFGRAIDMEFTILGEKLFVTKPVIEDNVIENGSVGILNLNGYDNEVRNNVIRNNVTGAQIGMQSGDDTLHHLPPVWEGNVFEGNYKALIAYASGAPRNGTVSVVLPFHKNSFIGTTCTDILAGQMPANVDLTVDASQNWWGSSAGPVEMHDEDCPAIDGDNINTLPWLTSAP